MNRPKAFADTVLVAEIPKEAARSGIVIPDEVNMGPNRGVVESVGHLIEDHGLQPGMLVYYCDHHDHPKIGDATVVPAGCIMAYEELES